MEYCKLEHCRGYLCFHNFEYVKYRWNHCFRPANILKRDLLDELMTSRENDCHSRRYLRYRCEACRLRNIVMQLKILELPSLVSYTQEKFRQSRRINSVCRKRLSKLNLYFHTVNLIFISIQLTQSLFPFSLLPAAA